MFIFIDIPRLWVISKCWPEFQYIYKSLTKTRPAMYTLYDTLHVAWFSLPSLVSIEGQGTLHEVYVFRYMYSM